ncbi:hypothetical protein A2154_03425 [Candidatus Gottesmanbacteria bacterium RBG_16_43_7]|uniref:Glycosyltransferase 2-like domain-containing protein n=1 Tax=Candidatus Gottesmanbacteria bacterium RBG_16_43_7 TaxID=1798373 RepID=A0A1F5ZA71_9BACT|nr:MAG: hypothetical protein A2154_03425 [Candidatus Gottesmanbacteria bacterium RBG_16_43_7]
MKVRPRFSIIIPTLNEEQYLPVLLKSLAVQTSQDFEVIIADGTSTDRTVEIARSFKNKLPKLSIVISQTANLPLQRNLGAKNASGNWLVFADADGLLLPYFIERITDFVEHSKATVFTTWFRPDSEVPGDALITLLANISIEMSVIIKRPHAPGPLTIIERNAFFSVGGFDENVKYLEDYDLSYRLRKQRGIGLEVLRETLCIWSLRRLRTKGTLRYAQTYAKSALSVIINKPLRNLPGYIMGGQVYDQKKKPLTEPVIKSFQEKLRKLYKEFF